MDTWQRIRRGTRRAYTLAYAAVADVKVGPRAIVMLGAVLKDDRGGSLTIGEASVVHRGAMLLPYGGFIRIGRYCRVNPYSVLYGHGGLFIGDHVRIAAHCVIVPANHGIALDAGLIADQPLTRKGIRIGDNVWIGAHCIVLPGVTIGEGAVIGSGSVVTKNIPSWSVAAGNPARVIRQRGDRFKLNDRRSDSAK